MEGFVQHGENPWAIGGFVVFFVRFSKFTLAAMWRMDGIET